MPGVRPKLIYIILYGLEPTMLHNEMKPRLTIANLYAVYDIRFFHIPKNLILVYLQKSYAFYIVIG